jgi:hypothetical protein
MLTERQKAVAQDLFMKRPETLPGTRAIVNVRKAALWYKSVTKCMIDNKIQHLDDIQEFCDIAGVAD